MRTRDALVGILVVALLLRIVVALAWAPRLHTDAADYDRLARSLVEGRGYVDEAGRPTAWRPPGYPAFVAGVYAVAGPRPGAVRIAQALVGTAVVALTWVAARAAVGPGGALVAAGLVALDPAAVFGVSRLLSEGLFTALLLAGFVLLDRARTGRGTRATGVAVAAGAVLGLATLVRGALILLPIFLVPAWLLAGGGRRRDLLAALLGFGLALTPWAVRNADAVGAFVPVATQGGMTLYSGNAPVDGWRFGMLPSDSLTDVAATLPEAEASAYLTGATLDLWRDRPERLPALVVLKTAFFWAPFDWEVLPWPGVLNPVYAFVLVFLALALWRLARTRPPWREVAVAWPVWLPVVYMLAIALIFYGSPRFRMPVEPYLAMGAAAGLVGLARRAGVRVAVRRAAWVGAAVAIVMLAAEPLKAVVRTTLGMTP